MAIVLDRGMFLYPKAPQNVQISPKPVEEKPIDVVDAVPVDALPIIDNNENIDAEQEETIKVNPIAIHDGILNYKKNACTIS